MKKRTHNWVEFGLKRRKIEHSSTKPSNPRPPPPLCPHCDTVRLDVTSRACPLAGQEGHTHVVCLTCYEHMTADAEDD